MKHKETKLLNVSQASQYLGVSAGSLRRWADAGQLEHYLTPGGQRRFTEAQLDAVLTHHATQPGDQPPP